MEIRQARGEGEIEVVRDLLREFAAEVDGGHGPAGLETEVLRLPGEYAPPDGRLLLVWIEDRPSGCGALRRVGDEICEVKRLYLKPEYRRAGRGHLIVLSLIREAVVAGYRRMTLDTLPTMAPA